VLDAYIYGFALQEKGLPMETAEETVEAMRAQAQNVPDMRGFPYLSEGMREFAEAGYDYATEFEFGLDLILDALERFPAAGQSAARPG